MQIKLLVALYEALLQFISAHESFFFTYLERIISTIAINYKYGLYG